MKQIKPTIIYNETQWTPIVALNYKTQITNTQWTALSINPQASNSETIQKRANRIIQRTLTDYLFTFVCVHSVSCAAWGESVQHFQDPPIHVGIFSLVTIFFIIDSTHQLGLKTSYTNILVKVAYKHRKASLKITCIM